MKTTTLVVLAVVALGLLAGEARAQSTTRRLAVVVGANEAAPGRRPLRYSHGDAAAVADVLTRAAGFAPGDVAVLLDPEPGAVLRALDDRLRAASDGRGDAVLLFYYSGHADTAALYPRGRALPLEALRKRLDDGRAKVRIGIIDACRGGGWTGTKGLTPSEPFPVNVPLALTNQGSILIASSSGTEDAHESESLRGSFFTHHWNAALRGAADRNGDRAVTVSEAFEYAQALTIRDTAIVTEAPQHPSFRLDLRGRQDLVLVSLQGQRALVTVRQEVGPLQLVHLDSGLVVLESPPGRRTLRLALRPGRYLVRRRAGAQTRARELEVAEARPAELLESDLEPIAMNADLTKGAEPHPASHPSSATILPAGVWDLQLALGVRHAAVIDPGIRLTDGGRPGPAGILRLSRGIGRGWHLALPLAAAYGAGDPERREWVGWFGAPVFGFGYSSVEGWLTNGLVGAGADVKQRAGASGAVNASVAALGAFRWSSMDPTGRGRQGPTTWSSQLSLGYSHLLGDRVELNLGVSAGATVLLDGALATGPVDAADRGLTLAFGSVQRRALRALPLVRLYVTRTMSLEGHVIVAYSLPLRAFTETYLAGASFTF